MPKVTQPVARKDYPNFGIVKGQKHYRWVLKTGPRSSREYRQATPPKRSQLTSSDFLGQLYEIFDTQIQEASSPDDLRSAADELRNLGSEQQDKYNNMPEGLQQGDTGQMLEQRASGCESAADTIESVADNLHGELSEIADAITEHETWENDEPEDVDSDAHRKWEDNEPDDRSDDESDAVSNAVSEAMDAESECEG